LVGCSFKVINTLGAGFLEKNYENALAHELRKAELTVAQQNGVTVEYDGITTGTYAVDLLVEETIIVELKAVRALDHNHMAQCLNSPESDRIASLSVAELRQVAPRDSPHCPRSLNQHGSSACICVHPRLNILASSIRAQATSLQWVLAVDQNESDTARLGAMVDPGMVGRLHDYNVAGREVSRLLVEHEIDFTGQNQPEIDRARAMHHRMP
jgi:GxxExxY protein